MPSTSPLFPCQSGVLQARPGAFPLKDAQDLMAYPFFSLAKSPRLKPIEYDMYGAFIRVEPSSELGIATIWDADILVWAASQIVAARDAGLATAPVLSARPFAILTYIARGTGAHDYRRLKAALNRLQATRVTTTLRPLPDQTHYSFNWLRWHECFDANGRSAGIELTICEWLYRLVLDKSLMLTLDRAYFHLTGGLERWLYRIVRKHAGKQRSGWRFELRHLYQKSGSLNPFRRFAYELRDIIRRQPLPGYELFIEVEITGRVLLAFEPNRPPGGQAVNGLVRSDNGDHDLFGTPLSYHREPESDLNSRETAQNRFPNFESNRESNFSSVRQGVENLSDVGTAGEPL